METHEDPMGPGEFASGESNAPVSRPGIYDERPLGEHRPYEVTERFDKRYKFFDIPMRDLKLSSLGESLNIDDKEVNRAKLEALGRILQARKSLTTDGNTIDTSAMAQKLGADIQANFDISQFISTTKKPTLSMVERWLGVQTSSENADQPQEQSGGKETKARVWKLEQTITAKDESGIGFTHFSKISASDGKTLYITFGSMSEDPSQSTIVPETIAKGDETIAEMTKEAETIDKYERAFLAEIRNNGIDGIRFGAINSMSEIKDFIYNSSTMEKNLITRAPITMNQIRYELDYALADRNKKPETDVYKAGKAFFESRSRGRQ